MLRIEAHLDCCSFHTLPLLNQCCCYPHLHKCYPKYYTQKQPLLPGLELMNPNLRHYFQLKHQKPHFRIPSNCQGWMDYWKQHCSDPHFPKHSEKPSSLEHHFSHFPHYCQ
ncbi:hypothetical protein V8G54_036062 [Vigna mungo]|uniref:Uncharacterized protein n=1 Tax=Vigna mungo TaxID=3915 RepID=A0AAQ3MGZ2_VIGMU